MKKYLIVKQTHRYTKEKNIVYQGYAEVTYCEQGALISYVESDGHTHVSVVAGEELFLKRVGEHTTDLSFHCQKKTIGSVLSEFGTIELYIYTYKYIRKDNVIAVEYDIMNDDEVSDGYRILWIIKEEQA